LKMVKGKCQNVKTQTGKKIAATNSKQPAVSSPLIAPAKAKAVKPSAQVPSCVSCGTIVTDDIKALQCDRCQATDKWKCADCLNLPSDMYDHLVSDSNCTLRWFCTECDKQAMEFNNKTSGQTTDKLDALVTMVEKLLDKLADFEDKIKEKSDVAITNQIDMRLKILEDRFAKQEDELPDRLAALKSNVTSHLEEKISKSAIQDNSKIVNEDAEIEKRTKNIIIYRAPEVEANSAEERNDGDLVYVTELLENVFHVTPDTNSIEKLFRLGSIKNSSDTPRPLLVGFKDLAVKEKIWSNLKNLKEADARFKGISVAHDMTPRQREEVKRLIENAKKDFVGTSTDGPENYWFRVVGLGSKMRVIKKRKED